MQRTHAPIPVLREHRTEAIAPTAAAGPAGPTVVVAAAGPMVEVVEVTPTVAVAGTALRHQVTEGNWKNESPGLRRASRANFILLGNNFWRLAGEFSSRGTVCSQ